MSHLPSLLRWKSSHIVLTRDKDIFDDYDNLSKKAFFEDSIEAALYAAKDYQERKRLDGRNIFVIGGEEIYKQFLPFATRILLNRNRHNEISLIP